MISTSSYRNCARNRKTRGYNLVPSAAVISPLHLRGLAIRLFGRSGLCGQCLAPIQP